MTRWILVEGLRGGFRVGPRVDAAELVQRDEQMAQVLRLLEVEADLTSWARAISTLRALAPALVVQGHGAPGHPDPLGHTLALLSDGR